MISRRDVLSFLAAAGVAARFAPPELFAQAPQAVAPNARTSRVGVELYGKDKLIIRSVRPPDFETPVSLLNSFITPNDTFYVRSHIPIPQIDAARWALKIGGEVNSPIALSLDQIRKLRSEEHTSELQ